MGGSTLDISVILTAKNNIVTFQDFMFISKREKNKNDKKIEPIHCCSEGGKKEIMQIRPYYHSRH